jgi:opacity protein-like surface antigen
MSAQPTTARFEAYGGFDYVRFNINANVSGFPPSSSYNGFGGGGQLEYNAIDWLGIVGDFSGYGVAGHGAAFSYLFGPRANFRRGQVTPFGQVLLGGVASTSGIGRPGPENNFAMTVGGGLDYTVSKHLAVRPVQAEYFLTKIPDGLDNRQDNFRFSTGIAVRLNK